MSLLLRFILKVEKKKFKKPSYTTSYLLFLCAQFCILCFELHAQYFWLQVQTYTMIPFLESNHNCSSFSFKASIGRCWLNCHITWSQRINQFEFKNIYIFMEHNSQYLPNNIRSRYSIYTKAKKTRCAWTKTKNGLLEVHLFKNGSKLVEEYDFPFW